MANMYMNNELLKLILLFIFSLLLCNFFGKIKSKEKINKKNYRKKVLIEEKFNIVLASLVSMLVVLYLFLTKYQIQLKGKLFIVLSIALIFQYFLAKVPDET